MKYVFREDEPLRIKAAKDADPNVIGNTLQDIAARNSGELTPDVVVTEAADPKHQLHRFFEWDDKVAAHQHRLYQARSLIRVVRVEDPEAREGTSRAFLSVSDKGGVSYRSLGDVKRSAEMQMAVLRSAERDLEAFERRHRDLLDVCENIVEARGKIKTRIERLEKRPQ